MDNYAWRIPATRLKFLCITLPGKSFALKAHVRHLVERTDSYVRTIAHAFDEVNKGAFFAWGSIKPGLPFLKVVGSFYFDPRPAWGSRLPYLSTLMVKTGGHTRTCKTVFLDNTWILQLWIGHWGRTLQSEQATLFSISTWTDSLHWSALFWHSVSHQDSCNLCGTTAASRR